MSRTSYSLNREIAKDLIPEAIKLSSSIKTDELDCSKSFSRQPTDKTPEEILQIGLDDERTVWTFIEKNMSFMNEGSYFDVGCSTASGNPRYLLWINLSIDDGKKLISKYKLEREL